MHAVHDSHALRASALLLSYACGLLVLGRIAYYSIPLPTFLSPLCLPSLYGTSILTFLSHQPAIAHCRLTVCHNACKP